MEFYRSNIIQNRSMGQADWLFGNNLYIENLFAKSIAL